MLDYQYVYREQMYKWKEDELFRLLKFDLNSPVLKCLQLTFLVAFRTRPSFKILIIRINIIVTHSWLVDDNFLIILIIDCVIRSDKYAYKFVISFEIPQFWH